MNKLLTSAILWPWRRILSVFLAIGVGLVLGSILRTTLPSPEPSRETSPWQNSPHEKSERTTHAIPSRPALPSLENEHQDAIRHAISPASQKLFALTTRFAHLSNNEFLLLAKSPPGGRAMQTAVLHAWAEQDPEGMYEALLTDRNISPERLREWMKYAISTLTKADPARLIQKLDQLPGSDQTHALRLDAIASLKNTGDYGHALELEAKWRGNTWAGTDSEPFAKWVLADPARAISKTQLLPPGIQRRVYLTTIGEALATTDPETAVQLGKTLPLEDQEPYLKALIGAQAKEDPVSAIAFLESIATDPETLSAAAPAIELWMKESPEDAIAWSETHLVGKERMTILVDAITKLASSDLQAAADTAYGLRPGPTRNMATGKVFSALLATGNGISPDEIEEWITEYPDPKSRGYALASVSRDLVRGFPELAVSLAEYEDRTLAPSNIIQQATEFLATKDVASATAWVQALPPRNREIAEKVLARWQAE